MNKIFFFMLFATASLMKITDYNQMLQVLYSSKGLLLFIQNRDEAPFDTFRNDLKEFIQQNQLDQYYQVGESSCELLPLFCQQENVNPEENSAVLYTLTYIDVFSFKDAEELKRKLFITIDQPKSSEEI